MHLTEIRTTILPLVTIIEVAAAVEAGIVTEDTGVLEGVQALRDQDHDPFPDAAMEEGRREEAILSDVLDPQDEVPQAEDHQAEAHQEEDLPVTIANAAQVIHPVRQLYPTLGILFGSI